MVRRLPPLNSVRAFEAAARHGSFTLAAEELFVTPAAISHQVKSLETFLGVALFHRHARGLTLTDAGGIYAPGLTKGLNHLARAEGLLRERAPRGLLRLSVLPSFANLWLAPRVGGFQHLYPEITLQVEAEHQLTDFSSGKVDFGIRYGTGDYPGLWTRTLFTETVFPVCSPALLNKAPLRGLADLEHHVLLHDYEATDGEPSLTWKPWLRRGSLSVRQAETGIFFNESTSLYRAASAGAGVALGRSVILSEMLGSGRLVRPMADELPAESAYFLVTTESMAETVKGQAFINWMLAQAATLSNDRQAGLGL
ncbi:MAG: transcriptional regulator GcvA [Magnetospiraceae bacterium]